MTCSCWRRMKQSALTYGPGPSGFICTQADRPNCRLSILRSAKQSVSLLLLEHKSSVNISPIHSLWTERTTFVSCILLYVDLCAGMVYQPCWWIQLWCHWDRLKCCTLVLTHLNMRACTHNEDTFKGLFFIHSLLVDAWQGQQARGYRWSGWFANTMSWTFNKHNHQTKPHSVLTVSANNGRRWLFFVLC